MRQFKPVKGEAGGKWPVTRAMSEISSVYGMCLPILSSLAGVFLSHVSLGFKGGNDHSFFAHRFDD